MSLLVGCTSNKHFNGTNGVNSLSLSIENAVACNDDVLNISSDIDYILPDASCFYSSLDEINSANKVSLCCLDSAEVTDEQFYEIDNGDYIISVYDFELDGNEYSLRVAETTNDISGILINDIPFMGNNPSKSNVVKSDNSGYQGAVWFNNNLQYCLILNDNGTVDSDMFGSMIYDYIVKTLSPNNN